ncbi:hypothetical protein [Halalkalibacter akibai]|uniref:Uncharacterized protein n=1 Tax=Halalkalibacter akibai (strain ATCC 43226 / DSM 21942 / CIP 109018 / JCM 9157 / 1139) TaxID=1236973 RepID=W4QZA1_HALA3|nr:hypothetical protein [Halalkalibacter akibai]GAE37401.1 hypothetical protein JCM9157_4678 [Halalkalibacter akibai JCM 9157]
MRAFIDKVFVHSLILFILAYFISTIWTEVIFLHAMSAAGFIMLISILIVMPKRVLVLPILLISLSIAIVWLTSSPLGILWSGLREMSSIIPLVILITLISWIISHRPYVKALLSRGQNRIHTPIRFYTFTAAISHFISSFMTVGGIVFTFQMFQNLKRTETSNQAWDFTLSTAIMRGFTLTVLWTAVHPAFAYVIAGTNAPLIPTVLKGLGLALIGLVLAIFIFKFQMNQRKINVDVVPDFKNDMNERLDGLVWKFLIWVALLMGGIYTFNQGLDVNILLAVPVVIMVVTTLYFVCNRALAEYKQRWRRLMTVDLGNKKKEMILILSAGLLVGALKETGYGEVLFGYFLTGIDWLNLNVLIGLTFVVILLGFCGFPPIPAMVLLSGILMGIPGGYSTDLVALSLLLGVAVTLVIAPVTVPLLLISSQNKRSLAENGFRWNIVFGVSLLIVGIVYIQVLTLF